MSFADNLIELRKNSNLSQEDVADKIGVSPKGKHIFGKVKVGDKG